MSDKVSGLTVILDKDVSEEAATDLSAAIRQMRGVIRVERERSEAFPEAVARARFAEDLAGRFRSILDDLWRV